MLVGVTRSTIPRSGSYIHPSGCDTTVRELSVVMVVVVGAVQ